MNIAKFCIRHKVTTLLAVIMIAVFGVVYTTQLQMALLPNIEYPAAYVYCYYNGAGPEDIEQLVTRPLESAIMSVPGVDSVTSSSADSISTIQIMYVENTDVDIAATKLREKFDALSLPDGCGSPVILNINVSEMMPSAIVGLLGDDLAALQQQAENVVAPTLERIDGVPSIAAMASRSEVSKATSATSPRRTVPPVWSGMLMLATSSTVESCASVVTESFWLPL